MSSLPDLSEIRAIHMTGIKGTGMAALAEVFRARGVSVSGSDVAERFYTDELLERIRVVPHVGFKASHLPESIDLLVYSAAYDEDNPERQAAVARGVPQRSYTEILGALSRQQRSVAISGVHGKTSTTAMVGMMIAESEIPGTVVVGSAVGGFGGSATLIKGDALLVAETCEYRRHFLDFTPEILLITNVEADHLDYFRDREDVIDAFVEFGTKVVPRGTVVYCADDDGALKATRRITAERPDLSTVPYGFTAEGIGAAEIKSAGGGVQRFRIALTDDEEWTLRVPGTHMVQNAAGAIIALNAARLSSSSTSREDALPSREIERWRRGLDRFTGTRRRSEIIADIGGILVVDDYAHHPTAISKTLAGYRSFWPGRRIVVDFMSHTYTRTEALLPQFATAFGDADVLFLNDIYASARETYHGGITGQTFSDALRDSHSDVRYVPDFEDAATAISRELTRGDIFVTMGAGDNFRIGSRVVDLLGDKSR